MCKDFLLCLKFCHILAPQLKEKLAEPKQNPLTIVLNENDRTYTYYRPVGVTN